MRGCSVTVRILKNMLPTELTQVSYQFTGRVLKEGDYPVRGYSQYYIAKTIMVEGQMVQMLFGFKVAAGEVRFTKGFGC